MFTIRSKVQNTPIPSYTSYNNRRSRIPTSDERQSLNKNTKSKRKRKKKRRASEININDYPSAKRFMFVFLWRNICLF